MSRHASESTPHNLWLRRPPWGSCWGANSRATTEARILRGTTMISNDERSFSSVLEDIVGNIQGIIRSEVRLAKAEVQEEAGKAGKAARLLGVGAVLAFYATGFLFLTCVYALETAVDPWLA